MASFNKFNSFVEALAEKVHNLQSDVLKVMLTASQAARCRTLAEQRGLDDKAAAKQVEKGDANRADYLKRFYGIGHESPADYDLVLNTDRLGPEGAVRLVVQAAT